MLYNSETVSPELDIVVVAEVYEILSENKYLFDVGGFKAIILIYCIIT